MTPITGILQDLPAPSGNVNKPALRAYLSAREAYSVMDDEYGVIGDGVADDAAGIQAAIDDVPDGSVLVFKPGLTYKLDSHANDPAAYWTADGDATLATQIPYDAALSFRNRENLTVIAYGATFDCPDEYTTLFYKSVNCKWLGGVFNGDASYVGTTEECGMLILRSINVWVEDAVFDLFYRNVFIYKSSWCGAKNCRSTNGSYFCFYGAASLDVAISGEPTLTGDASETVFDTCYAQGGKYGNFVLERAVMRGCTSIDAGRQGVGAAHVRTDNGTIRILGGRIYESSDQNTGDVVDCISIGGSEGYIASGSGAVSGAEILGVKVIGGRKGIEVVGADNTIIMGCEVRDFYLSGITGLTRTIGSPPVNLHLRNLVISGNIVGPFKAASTVVSSTYSTKAAVAVESNDSVAVQKATVAGNIIDGNNGGAISPTGTWYELACNDSNVHIDSSNVFRGTGTQQRTGRFKTVNTTRDVSTASGTQAVTGVGFKPSAVIILAAKNTGDKPASIGFTSGTLQANNFVLNTRDGAAADTWGTGANSSIVYTVDASNIYAGYISSFDDDGFTITWTKTGTPTGTVQVQALAIR